jgi:hypothetical protein
MFHSSTPHLAQSVCANVCVCVLMFFYDIQNTKITIYLYRINQMFLAI